MKNICSGKSWVEQSFASATECLLSLKLKVTPVEDAVSATCSCVEEKQDKQLALNLQSQIIWILFNGFTWRLSYFIAFVLVVRETTHPVFEQNLTALAELNEMSFSERFQCHQETYGMKTRLSALHADSWLFRSASAGWSTETHGCVSNRSLWAGWGTCILTASCPQGEGEQMLVVPSVNASQHGTRGDAVSRCDRTACSWCRKNTVFVSTVTCHSAGLTQGFRCFKKVIKALFRVKLNNDISLGLEIHADLEGLRSVATCANDMKLHLFKPLLFSFFLSAYKFDTIQFN